jgi:hypothetical protein
MTKPARKLITLDYKPRSQFEGFHDRQERFAILVAHRRCGKTVACVNDLLVHAVRTNQPDARFAYVAPLFSQAKDIAWTYLKKYSAPLLAAEPNETELRVDLVNGSRIRLYGADNPDRLRGLYFDGVVLDEYADMRPSVWTEVIRPMLSDRTGFAVFIGTPKGKNAFWELWHGAQSSDSGLSGCSRRPPPGSFRRRNWRLPRPIWAPITTRRNTSAHSKRRSRARSMPTSSSECRPKVA